MQTKQQKKIHALKPKKRLERQQLLKKLETREIPLTGGQFTRGNNFHMSNFSNDDLKRMLESSRPLGSSFKRSKSSSAQKEPFVLEKINQEQNINTDKLVHRIGS